MNKLFCHSLKRKRHQTNIAGAARKILPPMAEKRSSIHDEICRKLNLNLYKFMKRDGNLSEYQKSTSTLF